jgi:hypothetical protein
MIIVQALAIQKRHIYAAGVQQVPSKTFRLVVSETFCLVSFDPFPADMGKTGVHQGEELGFTGFTAFHHFRPPLFPFFDIVESNAVAKLFVHVPKALPDVIIDVGHVGKGRTVANVPAALEMEAVNLVRDKQTGP